jgi:hypothetical protein
MVVESSGSDQAPTCSPQANPGSKSQEYGTPSSLHICLRHSDSCLPEKGREGRGNDSSSNRIRCGRRSPCRAAPQPPCFLRPDKCIFSERPCVGLSLIFLIPVLRCRRTGTSACSLQSRCISAPTPPTTRPRRPRPTRPRGGTLRIFAGAAPRAAGAVTCLAGQSPDSRFVAEAMLADGHKIVSRSSVEGIAPPDAGRPPMLIERPGNRLASGGSRPASGGGKGVELVPPINALCLVRGQAGFLGSAHRTRPALRRWTLSGQLLQW